MNYDLFISYARADNQQGRINALVAEIERDFNRMMGRPMRTFFDTQEIKGMHDWRDRILEGLRESVLLLVGLSPNYLKSEYCEWELAEFLKHEASRGFTGNAVAPVYLVEIPAWADKDYDRQCAEWVRDLRGRQYFDFQAFHTNGVGALTDPDIETRFRDLTQRLREQIKRSETSAVHRGNVDRHNPHFQGRQRDLAALHQALHRNQVGMLAAVHGVGGLGKTALALEYAHAYGHEYGGGRWQVRCEGREDLRLALASLEPALGLQFTDTEAADPDRQLARVLAELHRLAETVPAAPRCLLILDNVDRPALLSAAQTARVPQSEWLHVILTTRLNQNELGGASPDRQFLAVDELPEDDAVELIESYLRGGRFPAETEREAAREIARLLGGFTLAVENAAVFLAQPEVGVTAAGFSARLKQEGLAGLEKAAAGTEASVRHGEKLVTATLAPTLERLRDPEMLALRSAALLPANKLALTWIRALLEAEFRDIGVEAEPGYPDAWLSLVRRLLDLRLLKPSEVTDEQGKLLVARMHRVVQAVVQARAGSVPQELLARLAEHAGERCEFIKANDHLPEHRWELEPLRDLAEWLLGEKHARASFIANEVGVFFVQLARYAEAESLLRRTLALVEQSYGPEHPEVAIRLNNLALLLQETNRLEEAEPLLRRALRINEHSYGPEHPNVAKNLTNLTNLFYATNRLGEAEPMMRRALAIDEQSYGPEHPDVACDLNNLAQLLEATNRLGEAEPLMRRALAIDEKGYGPEHPNVATRLSNLASLWQDTNRLGEAEPLMRRALSIDEQSFGPEHPRVAIRLSNLASLLLSTNRLEEAEPLMRRALALDEQSFGPEHPRVAIYLNNLAALLSRTNQVEEAKPLIRRALAISRA
jgi:tetratricopeptide (TPR) repeat protein